MNNSKIQFYKILSNYFNENTVEIKSIDDVKFLETTAILNICLPFFVDGAKQSNIAVNPELNMFVMQLVAKNYKNLSVQDKLLKMLSDNDINCAVLKGSTVSVLYPEPHLRSLGDIDLLVSEKDYIRSIEILTGKVPDAKEVNSHDFHYSFDYENIRVELHKDIDEFEDDEQNIKEYMQSALDNTEEKELEQFKFPCFKDEYQAVMLLIHTKRHYFENQLNIRLLLDWAMFAESIETQYWNNVIYPLLESFSLAKWADALNCVLKEYLRLDTDEKIHNRYSKDITETLANQFISDRLNKNKIKNEEKKEKSFFDIFYMMSHTAMRDFKLAKKCKVLMPFFWIIIVIRYFYRMKTGKRGKLDYAKYSTDYKNKNKLFSEINK